MRISDWSSDVCSSDLIEPEAAAAPVLTPAQQEVLEAPGARPHERPEFDPRLRAELREELQDRHAPVAAQVPEGQSLWLSKNLLSTVHGCEGQFLASEEEELEWAPSTARGAGCPHAAPAPILTPAEQ